MRILIVIHSEISLGVGAGGVALNLAEALRNLGHTVKIWSPYPLPLGLNWWRRINYIRHQLDEFLKLDASFDLVDCHVTLITSRVRKIPIVVTRSTQPNILYLLYGIAGNLKKIKSNKFEIRYMITFLSVLLYSLFILLLTLQGWKKANYILCLGSAEFQWMTKYLPHWKKKLIYYVGALSEDDRTALSKVRLERKIDKKNGIRFIWIGRWVYHKGTDVLIDFIIKRSALSPHDTFTVAGCGVDAEGDCPPVLIASGRVKIIPSFTRSELYSLLADHDVGLFTSRIEGWGLSLNEMLEAGLVVYATQTGGTADLQPHFQERLRPFPPPVDLTPDVLPEPSLEDNYYKIFNFSGIARTYETLVNGY